MTTLADILTESSRDGRVCPKPSLWNDLYNLLPDCRRQANGGWEPPLPLILAAWYATDDAEKRERFELHLKWAADHGALQPIAAFLRNLPLKDWHTGN